MKRYLLILLLPLIAFLTYNTPQVQAFVKEVFKTKISLQAAEWGTLEGAAATIKQVLEEEDKDQLASDLYALMTSDFKEMVSWENFKESVTETNLKVLSTEVVTEEETAAIVKMRLESSLGQKDFSVYLKKENGQWKIFGTEEI